MAGLQSFRNGVWHPLLGLQIYRNGAWRRLKTLKVYSGGAWRLIGSFAPTLSLTLAGSSSTEIVNGFPQTSYFVSATPTGGVAPYSYDWSVISGSSGIISPSSAKTQVTPAGTGSVTFRCSCTDAAGQSVIADLPATFP